MTAAATELTCICGTASSITTPTVPRLHATAADAAFTSNYACHASIHANPTTARAVTAPASSKVRCDRAPVAAKPDQLPRRPARARHVLIAAPTGERPGQHMKRRGRALMSDAARSSLILMWYSSLILTW